MRSDQWLTHTLPQIRPAAPVAVLGVGAASTALGATPNGPDARIAALGAEFAVAWEHLEFLCDLYAVAESVGNEEAKSLVSEAESETHRAINGIITRISKIPAHSKAGLAVKVHLHKTLASVEPELETSLLADAFAQHTALVTI